MRVVRVSQRQRAQGEKVNCGKVQKVVGPFQKMVGLCEPTHFAQEIVAETHQSSVCRLFVGMSVMQNSPQCIAISAKFIVLLAEQFGVNYILCYMTWVVVWEYVRQYYANN